jgi:hypothetical protein
MRWRGVPFPVEMVGEGVALGPTDLLQLRFGKEFAHPAQAEIGDRDDVVWQAKDLP